MTTVAVLAHAGKSVGGGLPELRQLLADQGITDPMWFEVGKSKEAPRFARKVRKKGAGLVFVWGGDGMVQRCIDVLAGSEVALAIVPAGTANLLATNLGIPADIRSWEQVTTYEELMALMARQDFALLGGPGDIINYSNEGYVLLAAIVEQASGLSFADYLQAHILDPLDLRRTGLYTRSTPPLEPEVIPFAVDTSSGTREVFPSPAWWDQGSMFGNGGLKSTTQDLLRYLEIYRTGGISHGQRVLSEAGIATMTTPHQPIPAGGGYGYGLRVLDVPGLGKVVEHGGGNKGVATQVVVLPEHGITAVALTNLANAPASKLAYGAVNAELGRSPETPWTEYPQHTVEPGRLQRYVGEYEGQPGTTVRFQERDGSLYLAAGAEEHPALPYADDAFLVEATEEAYRFLEDASGEVWAAFSGMRTLRRRR